MSDAGNPSENPNPDWSRYEVPYQADAATLLALLGSAPVYGTPMMAVRELVQNAFNAVLMAIARARVALPPEVDAAALGVSHPGCGPG